MSELTEKANLEKEKVAAAKKAEEAALEERDDVLYSIGLLVVILV